MERVETHWRKGARILCRDPCRRPTRLHFSRHAHTTTTLGKIRSGQPPPASSFFIQDSRVILDTPRELHVQVGIGGVPGPH